MDPARVAKSQIRKMTKAFYSTCEETVQELDMGPRCLFVGVDIPRRNLRNYKWNQGILLK